jgi:hypothetical protein
MVWFLENRKQPEATTSFALSLTSSTFYPQKEKQMPQSSLTSKATLVGF